MLLRWPIPVQVLYFSAKGEVKGALQEELSTGRVKGLILPTGDPVVKRGRRERRGEEKPGLNYLAQIEWRRR